MLRIRLVRLKAESPRGLIPQRECDSKDADEAARKGWLAVVRELRKHDICCTANAADLAAEDGQLAVVQYLRTDVSTAVLARKVHCIICHVKPATWEMVQLPQRDNDQRCAWM